MPQQVHQQRTKKIDPDLLKQCKEFLEVPVPSSNIVFVDEFQKYMPLFNKELFSETDPNELDHLGREYYSQFSLMHPIQILTRTPDPNGIFHPGARGKFKLDKTIPARFRRVSTLNDLGKKVPALMNAFYNATVHTSGPFDERKGKFAKAIGEAIELADKKEGKMDAQRAEHQRQAALLISKNIQQKMNPDAKPQQPAEDESCDTGMFEWD